MPNYHFHQLSPYDLEILARDLLQAHWGVTIESFKTGKDGSIDLRYAAGSGKIVLQVMQLLKTDRAGQMSERYLQNALPKQNPSHFQCHFVLLLLQPDGFSAMIATGPPPSGP